LVLVLGISSAACTGLIEGKRAPNCTDCEPAKTGPNAGPGSESGGKGDEPGIEGIGWTTRFPRLSHAQWENTVRDLLRLTAVPELASTFTLDPPSRFDTYAVRTVSPNLWNDYQRAAEVLAKSVVTDPIKQARIVAPGTPPAEFVKDFGLRAFRRPLTQEEVDQYVGLFAQGPDLIGGTDAFAAGVELTISAFLQSAHFLYRVESSTAGKAGKIWLNGYELATRLSYALWNSMPSDELLTAAGAGELTSPAGIENWARKALTDMRAASTLVNFHSQLFHVDQLGTTEKSKTLFPNFTTALSSVLQQEARLFFEEVTVSRNAGIAGILTAPVTFVNEKTAPFYGLDIKGSELQRVDLDPSKRAGFLTHVGFLSHLGTQTQSDPIRRGATIYTELLCQELIQPDNVPALPASKAGESNRERVEASTSVLPCSSCHEPYINPLGFAFENYDAIGQWRETDSGKPVDASATFELDEQTVSYANAVELSQFLAKSPMVHECYSQSLLEYILGRPVTEDEAVVKTKVAGASNSGATMQDLVAKIATLETFRARPQEN
jgi:hypothetical protein